MTRFARYTLLALVALAFTACDTTEDDLTDAELFVGQWTLLQVEDAEGDKTAMMQAAGDFSIVFDADDEFVLTFDPAQGDPQVLDNTYSVNEATRKLTLQAATPQGATVDIILDYNYDGDDEVTLTMPASYVQIVGALLPPFQAFQGTVELTLERV